VGHNDGFHMLNALFSPSEIVSPQSFQGVQPTYLALQTAIFT